MNHSGVGTPGEHITTFFTGEFTAVTVFDHVTGEIPEVNAVLFERIVPAILVVRVQVVLGLAGTAAHAEIVLIVQHLENVLERHDRSRILDLTFNRSRPEASRVGLR